MTKIKVAKWGNSLAIRIPVDVVRELDLKEGELVGINGLGAGRFELCKDNARARWLNRIDELAITLPEGYKFDREEANAR
jgi:antitoxin MazE